MDVLQLDVEDEEEVLARVAAIDVAKASGMVCTRVPHEKTPGRRVTRVWQVSATTNAIIELADQLVGAGIERVVLESTSDYWRPFFYLLEARGLGVAGQRPRRQERPWPAQDGQARRDLVGQAERARHAACVIRPTGADPPAA